MDSDILELSLSPIPLEGAATIESIRLLALEDRPHLVTSVTAATGGTSTRFSSRPLTGGGSTSVLAVIPQILAVPPRWDVASGGRGGPAIVYEVAGGAMNALFLARMSSAGKPSTWLTARHQRESFGHPRFFKGRRDGEFSAIVDSTRAVAFPGPPGGAYTPLIEAEQALVVRCGPGLVLIYKTTRPGPVRGSDVFRGLLRCVPLGEDLRPVGPVIAPFGDTTVFELDADVRGAELVVIATTETGVALSLLRMEAGAVAVAWSTAAQEMITRNEPLFSPSLLATSDGLSVAALEVGTAGRTRLLLGRLHFPTHPLR